MEPEEAELFRNSQEKRPRLEVCLIKRCMYYFAQLQVFFSDFQSCLNVCKCLVSIQTQCQQSNFQLVKNDQNKQSFSFFFFFFCLFRCSLCNPVGGESRVPKATNKQQKKTHERNDQTDGGMI